MTMMTMMIMAMTYWNWVSSKLIYKVDELM